MPSALMSIRCVGISVGVLRLAIGREPHHLVFAGVHLEAGVIGEGGVQQAERVREMNLLDDLEVVAVADARAKWWPIRPRRPS